MRPYAWQDAMLRLSPRGEIAFPMSRILPSRAAKSSRHADPERKGPGADHDGLRKIITFDARHALLASRPVEVSALIDEASTATAA